MLTLKFCGVVAGTQARRRLGGGVEDAAVAGGNEENIFRRVHAFGKHFRVAKAELLAAI